MANVLCNRKFITHQIEHGDRKYLYYLIQPKNIRDHHFQSFPDILYPELYPGYLNIEITKDPLPFLKKKKSNIIFLRIWIILLILSFTG